jgi:hypothetical protein
MGIIIQPHSHSSEPIDVTMSHAAFHWLAKTVFAVSYQMMNLLRRINDKDAVIFRKLFVNPQG